MNVYEEIFSMSRHLCSLSMEDNQRDGRYFKHDVCLTKYQVLQVVIRSKHEYKTLLKSADIKYYVLNVKYVL